MGAFNGVTTEDLLYCPMDIYGGGIKTRLFYAPADFFSKIQLPTSTGRFQELLLIENDSVEFKGSLTWSQVDILIDENELKSAIEGQIQRKKTKSKINFFILGFRSKVLGFMESLKNVPLVFGIKDSEGIFWILGNLRNRAFLETGEASTAKKYEDNAGLSATATANSPLYFFRGDLVIETGSGGTGETGGFIDLTEDY